jgi:hypothetical protein
MKDPNANVEAQGGAWLYAVAAAVAVALDPLFLPVFMVRRRIAFGDFWYSDWRGVLVAGVCSGVCAWAFLWCPRRHWIVKLVVLLLPAASLWNGVGALGSYIISGLKR